MNTTEKIDRLIATLRAVKKTRRHVAENGSKSGDFCGLTQRQRELASDRARVFAIELRRLEHEAHCLAVEIGIADFRGDYAYKESTAPAGMGREFLFEKRSPNITIANDK